jgi:hypothetical protein
MLVRVFAFVLGSAVALAACKGVPDSQLVGTWRTSTAEDAGKLQFHANHTFSGGEWSVTSTHQPPVIAVEGDWRISGSKLILDFRDTFHTPKHQELALLVRDGDHVVLRPPSGAEITLKREK